MVPRHKQSGFTMVEMLVVLAISAIVFSLIYKVYQSQLKSHTTQQELVEMQQNIRAVLYLMERDIRMAGNAPAGGPDSFMKTPIHTARAREIGFDMDLTTYDTFPTSMYGSVGNTGEQLSYFIDPGTGNLIRWANNIGNQVLLEARDIEDISFVYKNENGQTMNPGGGEVTGNSREDIRSVVITLNARIGTTAMVAPHEMQLRSEVKLRNLGLDF